MMKIFNTDFEISLRVLVLLSNVKKPVSIDYITTIDLFTTYGKNYGFLESNLHGDVSYKFSEIASRRTLVNKAVIELVLKNLIVVDKNSLGFNYSLSSEGEKLCSNMKSSYFIKYNAFSKEVINKTSNYDEVQLVNYATKQSLKGGR